MSPHSIAIVIPTYKAEPDSDERRCFERICHIFAAYPIVLCHPDGLDTAYYTSVCPPLRLLPMNPAFFNDLAAYSRLMLSADFYASLQEYDYLLICQLDVFVFRDDLPLWLDRGFDYVGAPWHRRAWRIAQYFIAKGYASALWKAFRHRPVNHAVGNGGFSLRKTDVFLDISQRMNIQDGKLNEDFFWAFLAQKSDGKKLCVPTDREAAGFCIETGTPHYMRHRRMPPMAVHAYKKYHPDYWLPIIADYMPSHRLS